MNVTQKSLDEIHSHWAIQAISGCLVAVTEAARFRFVSGALGSSVGFEFHDVDDELLERVATAFELAAVDGLQDLLHPRTDSESRNNAEQAMAAAHEAYEFRRVLPVPSDVEGRMFHVLHTGRSHTPATAGRNSGSGSRKTRRLWPFLRHLRLSGIAMFSFSCSIAG